MTVVYEGPSEIDGKPIVAVLTEGSKNLKTGNMAQIWILCQNETPLEAVKSGNDTSICGNCALRGDSCYVNLAFAPSSVYKAYKRGIYRHRLPKHAAKHRSIRIGAYGDIFALPKKIVKELIKASAGHTAYTHQWREQKAQYLKGIAIASVDSLQEYKEAKSLGWQTFRIYKDSKPLKTEKVCPAKPGKYECIDCLRCSGTGDDICTKIHGASWKIER